MMNSYLAQVPLFRGIPPSVLRRTAKGCELLRFGKGSTIFREGEPAECVWIVKVGWVYLVKHTPQGGAATIFTMTPDEAICGVSAFDHGAYSATAVAATDTELVRIPIRTFSDLLRRYPTFAGDVLLTCCHRIRHMAEAISFAQATVEQRLTYTLMRLQASFGDTLPVTHRELAQMAGTRWETSIRTVSRMKRRGWIASSRGRVTILDAQQLRASLDAGHGAAG